MLRICVIYNNVIFESILKYRKYGCHFFRFHNDTELIDAAEGVTISKMLSRDDQVCSLSRKKMCLAFEGNYRVEAKNPAGEASCKAKLVMQGKPFCLPEGCHS